MMILSMRGLAADHRRHDDHAGAGVVVAVLVVVAVVVVAVIVFARRSCRYFVIVRRSPRVFL
jgi:hypothetical protein